MKPITLSLDEALKTVIDRYNDDKIRKKFKGWVNALQFSFPDIEKAYTFAINSDEGIKMSEGMYADAAVNVSIPSDMFIQLLTKQINAITAYSSGLLKVEGDMKNLLKMRKLINF
ncbi:MAG TPA: SCP2 sterol-binding domain-containing protein [Candidatus Lokiarchaeia archaeon]|nr:SCP2 sterol-binding domain-containing protein [Candidatus Lokiarchaeia archaeon]